MGDGAAPAVGGGGSGDPGGAVRLPDRVDVLPVHGRAQRVPEGHAEQRPAHPAAEVLLLSAPPDGPGSRIHPDLPDTVRTCDAKHCMRTGTVGSGHGEVWEQ
ncbi:hypothetical protein SHIRM173S_10267 [Streptomyces hirsutus]